MGAWGTGIFEDDTAADVQDLYVRQLQNGASADEAEQEVCSCFAAELEDADDAAIVWFALAASEWKYGRLSDAVKERALQCIESGEDPARWHEMDKSLGKKRAKVLDKLREQLLSPQPKAKQVRKPRTFQCPWQVGDVYAFPLSQAVAAQDCTEAHFILFQVGGKFPFGKHVVPVIRCWLSENAEISEKPTFIKAQPVQRSDDSYIYAWEILSTSSRSVPKNLIFLGNYPVMMAADDMNDIEHGNSGLLWKQFEETIVRASQTKARGKIQLDEKAARERLEQLMRNCGLEEYIKK